MAFNPAAGQVAKAIRQRRIELHLTQAQLADLLGVDHNTVSRWEMARRSPSTAMFIRLLEVLDTTTDALMGGDK